MERNTALTVLTPISHIAIRNEVWNIWKNAFKSNEYVFVSIFNAGNNELALNNCM